MKRVTLFLCAASLIVIGCENKPAEKVEKSDSTAQTASRPPMDSASMMKAWNDYMTPGDIHKMIARDNGTWNADITMWMDPSAPPTKSTATAVNTMILGGRYQQSKHTGSFNGMPFEGISIMGYDNAKKKFVSSWVDNMGTGIMFMEGTWDEASKTINMKGKSTDPMTGKDMDVREAFKFVDENTQLLEMFDTRGGKETKTMEIKFTRKP